jgi:5'-deoxynucleotidase YfbR-like HD superfamily hydrolase
MPTPLQRETLIFIVRVWKEYLKSPQPQMRGEVEVVNSKEKQYFADLDELENLLKRNCYTDGEIREN